MIHQWYDITSSTIQTPKGPAPQVSVDEDGNLVILVDDKDAEVQVADEDNVNEDGGDSVVDTSDDERMREDNTEVSDGDEDENHVETDEE